MIREVLVPEEDPPGTVRASQHRSDRAVSISAETQVLEIVNQERAENNLGALAWNDLLFESARGHSVDMADQDYFSHESLDGRTPAQRVAAAGYDYNSMAENIAAGHGTPQAVMEGWMASDGHRANILSEDVCDLGVGYAYDAQSTYGHYWTQNFGRQAGVADCPIIPDTGSNSPPDTTGSDESGGGGSGGCFIESIQHTIP
ncbi:MAG: CAP domain-containing protein [Desulfobacteraceae bacterium]|nr:CAP domain-containing protein [Desulfobacteraceae bacterium]